MGTAPPETSNGLAQGLTKVYFIRHAKAGDREEWTRPDHLRPLTKPGLEQAEALVPQLAGEGVVRIFSSYYLRCVQTVEPLARERELEVEHHESLVEGVEPARALDLVVGAGRPIALCTHGDVMWGVIEGLRADGVEGADPRLGKKGSTWVLTVDGGRVMRAVYLEPPT